MYQFKLDNGSLTSTVFLDGSHLEEHYLDGVMIEIYFNTDNNISARFKSIDMEYVKNMEPEKILQQATTFVKKLKKQDLTSLTSTNWRTGITDILDNKRQSYFTPPPLQFKEYMTIQVKPFLV